MTDIDEKTWVYLKQRAGPMTIALKYQRPQLRASDLPSVRKEKNRIIRDIRERPFRRTPKDRLMLMLALMGWNSSIYTLTFSDLTLPESLDGTRSFWRRTVQGLRRMHGEPFRYVYAIEGLHGDHRWHVHAVLRGQDFTEAEVLRCWAGGKIEDVQPLLDEDHKTFYQRADYFTKERRDGLYIPRGTKQWVASPLLYKDLPPTQKTMSKSGSIRSPKREDVWYLENDHKENAFGQYNYKIWIEYP